MHNYFSNIFNHLKIKLTKIQPAVKILWTLLNEVRLWYFLNILNLHEYNEIILPLHQRREILDLVRTERVLFFGHAGDVKGPYCTIDWH